MMTQTTYPSRDASRRSRVTATWRGPRVVKALVEHRFGRSRKKSLRIDTCQLAVRTEKLAVSPFLTKGSNVTAIHTNTFNTSIGTGQGSPASKALRILVVT